MGAVLCLCVILGKNLKLLGKEFCHRVYDLASMDRQGIYYGNWNLRVFCILVRSMLWFVQSAT